jgi:hypothetical protein
MSILSFRTVRHFLAVEASSRNNRAASEIDPKADKHQTSQFVRLPKADSCTAAKDIAI